MGKPAKGVVANAVITEREILAIGWALNRARTFTSPNNPAEWKRLAEAEEAYQRLSSLLLGRPS